MKIFLHILYLQWWKMKTSELKQKRNLKETFVDLFYAILWCLCLFNETILFNIHSYYDHLCKIQSVQDVNVIVNISPIKTLNVLAIYLLYHLSTYLSYLKHQLTVLEENKQYSYHEYKPIVLITVDLNWGKKLYGFKTFRTKSE